MQRWKLGIAAIILGAAGLPAVAQDENKDQPRADRFLQIIQRFDKDGDGKLSDEERAAALEALQGKRAVPERSPAQRDNAEDRPGRPDAGLDAEQVFTRLDRNRDGKITKDELGDADNNGEITREELQAAFSRMREQTFPQYGPEQIFSRADQNQDGKITKDELNERTQWLLQADANEDGEITKEEAQAGFARMRERMAQNFNPEQIFTRMDQNSDGKLQKDELQGPFAQRFDDLDGDKNGEISKDEFQAAARTLRGLLGPGGPGGLPNVEQMFARLDQNSDGKLTKDELPERMANFLLRADSDGDGAVTKAELEAARPRFPPNRNQGEVKRPPADEKE
jgi:Ca2+-binding EF-hand superfamily protein